MSLNDTVQVGPHSFTVGQRVRMLTAGLGCDSEDNEAYYNVGDIATVVQIEHYSGPQGLGIGVELDNGIFNMFDAADEPPKYPFVPLSVVK
jgi:hypothetical protein